MSTAELRQVEQSIRQNQEYLDLAEALFRLKQNRDFRKVMLDGFFSKEAIRLVHLKSSPEMQSPEAQKRVLTQIDGIGALYQYFESIENQAELARKSLDADEQTREELLAQGIL